jgi:hypothetical protein
LGGGVRFRAIGLTDESVAAAGQGFDESRVVGRITQSISQPLDGIVQPMVEVDEGVGWPQPAAEILSRNQLTWLLQKHGKNLEGLVGKP